MITTIQRIHHKSFDNYEMGEIGFSRINLIYGLNGMGKSSFRDFLVKGIGDDSTNTEHSKEVYKVFSYDEDYKRDTLCIYDDKKGNSLESFYLGEKIREIIKAKEMVNENIEKAELKKQNQEEQLKKANI